MAGAEAAVQSFFLEKPDVPRKFCQGTKFLKWPRFDGEETAVPVTLKVDKNGFLIYWKEPNKHSDKALSNIERNIDGKTDTETLDISCIRDVRYGKYAREPKDSELSSLVSGSIPLHERCLTIVFGVNLVDLTFVNFVAVQADPQALVEEWADFLLKTAYHPLSRHISVATAVEKAHTKVTLETNQQGDIPVKKLMKVLGGKSSRVENALSAAGLPTSTKKSVDPEEMPLGRFKKLLQLCCPRPELDAVFADLTQTDSDVGSRPEPEVIKPTRPGRARATSIIPLPVGVGSQLGGVGARRIYISHNKFREFINTTQRDPKLNEILYPFISDDQATDLVANYEANIMFAQKGQLTQDGFDSYLQSDDNLITGIESYAEHQDMSFPLSHYFINSSHNTYLTGNQYKSRSSAEMYRQVLLTGCRCVELDCWEGSDGEPYINHGYTFCTPVSFKEVIEAVNECAFKTSPYPVVLSFENHVESQAGQAKMAEYCREIFKDKLLIKPLENFPIEPGTSLPPPKEMLYKIIIKNKKQKHVSHVVEAANQANAKENPPSVTSLSSNTSLSQKKTSPARTSAKQVRSKSADMGKRSTPIHIYPIQLSENGDNSEIPRISTKTKPIFEKTKSEPLMIVLSTNQSVNQELSEQLSRFTVSNEPLPEENEKCDAKPATVSPTKEKRENNKATNSPTKQQREDNKERIESSSNSKQLEANQTTSESDQLTEEQQDDVKDEAEIDSVTNDEKQENGLKAEAKKLDLNQNERIADSVAESKESEEISVDTNLTEESEDNSDMSEEEEEEVDEELEGNEEDKKDTAHKESRAYAAMSALVNYIMPVRFKRFDFSERRNRSYEVSSFTETTASRLLTFYPTEFVRYNCRQTSRIYPRGARVDSSNYNPQIYWNAGCQFVALNFQVLDLPMQLNLAFFEFNGGTGFMLKPEYMRRKDRSFDPFAKRIDGVVSTTLKIRIISGQFLSQQKLSTYVEVDMFGLPNDTRRKMFKTKTVDGNSTNPRYDSPVFSFKKIVLPSLAIIRIAVNDTSGNLVGQRFLKVEGLKPGYRYITLRNEGNQPNLLSSLFVHVQVKDFVPASHKDLAEMLADPISHLPPAERAEKERRERIRALQSISAFDELQEVEEKVTSPTIVGKSTNVDSLLDPDPKSSKKLQVPAANHGYNTLPRMPTNNRDNVLAYLKKFTPQTLDDMKLGKAYLKLEKDQEKLLNKLKKQHKHEFASAHRNLFGIRRSSSVLGALKKVTLMRRTSSPESSLSPEMMPEEDQEKKEILNNLLKEQLLAQRDFLIKEIKNYMREFESIVKNHQKSELKRLQELSMKEQEDIQKWKNAEKENKIKQIPSDLSRHDIYQRRKLINDSHFEDCVRDRTLLSTKQKERENTVVHQQNDIFNGLATERKTRKAKLEKIYQENLAKLNEICENMCAGLSRRPSSSINGTALATLPGDAELANDG